MKFTKVQGAGNDFVLIEANSGEHDWSKLVRDMCDRHYGVGADGLLLLLPSEIADFQMRIFNADGSESDACGNGLRCMVKYFIDRGLFNPKAHEIVVETRAGLRIAEISKINKTAKIQIGMGEPRFNSNDIPVLTESGEGCLVDIKPMIAYSLNIDGTELLLNFVSMGNPHAIYFQQEPVSDFPLSQLGPKVEHHKIFPRGINFEVVRVLDKDNVEARVWERGVGETLACGSGACAITVAGQIPGDLNNAVNIKLPGGTLEVEWDGNGEVFLSGPAEIVFSGEWPD